MTIPYIPAKYFHAGGNLDPVNRIVVHMMESQEKGDSAESCAHYFQTITRQASCHYCVDNNSIVQCVHDGDTAFHAPPNQHSIGIEHAGMNESWGSNAYENAELVNSAMLAADLSRKYWVPVYWLEISDLLAGKRGFTSHYNVSQAFHKSDHTDGKDFPHERWLNMVRFFLNPQGQPDTAAHPAKLAARVDVPTGGYLEIGEDGGVFTFDGAMFYGSYPGLNIDEGSKRQFGWDCVRVHDDGGYTLIATSREEYDFPAV